MFLVHYGYNRTGETGYRILAAQPELPDAVAVNLLQQIQNLKLTAETIGQHTGWIWRPLRNTKDHRLFGRIRAETDAHAQRNTIALRLAILDESECRQIEWQPFLLKELLENDSIWDSNVRAAAALKNVVPDLKKPNFPTPPLPLILPWETCQNVATEIAQWALESLSQRAREETAFQIPARQGNEWVLQIETLSVQKQAPGLSEKPKGRFPSIKMLALLSGIFLSTLLIAFLYWSQAQQTRLKQSQAQTEALKRDLDELRQQHNEDQQALTKADEKLLPIILDIKTKISQLVKPYYRDDRFLTDRQRKSFEQGLEFSNDLPADQQLQSVLSALRAWLEWEDKQPNLFQTREAWRQQLVGLTNQLQNAKNRIERLTGKTTELEKLASELQASANAASADPQIGKALTQRLETLADQINRNQEDFTNSLRKLKQTVTELQNLLNNPDG